MLNISRPAALALAVILLPWAALHASSTPGVASEKHDAAAKHITRQGMVSEFICGKNTKRDRKTPSEGAEKSHFWCTAAPGRDGLISTFRFATTR
jgi:hypothetical protein